MPPPTVLHGYVPPDAADVLELDGVAPDLSLLPRASLDAVVVTCGLERLTDARTVLTAIRRSLRPAGVLVCDVRNHANIDLLVQLLRSDPQRAVGGTIGVSDVEVHGYATAYKLLLEAGFLPDIVEVVRVDVPEPEQDALGPLLEAVRVAPERATKHLYADRYVLFARPIDGVDDDLARSSEPVTFVSCVNDDRQLHHNLLASPQLSAGSPHELILKRGMTSAAEGLNGGLREARHDLVVMVQQDVYLPSWWPGRLQRQWERAIASGPTPAVAGAFGLRYREGGRQHVGRVVDRDYLLDCPPQGPAMVDGLDEVLLVLPRGAALRFDPALAWHLYGTDIVLQAHAAGQPAMVLDLPCHHNSLMSEPGPAYHHSTALLAAKWPLELPIVTNSTIIDQDPRDARIRALESELEKAARAIAERDAELDVLRKP